MNFISHFRTVLRHILPASKVSIPAGNTTAQRTFSVLCGRPTCGMITAQPSNHGTLLAGWKDNVQYNQSCGYKVKLFPKRRCAGCYFVHKFGRLHVECTLKPRHKQMQKVMGMNYYKDDYSKGPWQKASIWGFRDKRVFYEINNELEKHDWLKGRIGKDL